MISGKNSHSFFSGNACKALFLFSFVAASLFPAAAFAQKAKELNDKNVREFILQTSKITEGHEQEMDQSEILAYLDKHLQEDARFKSSVQFHVPGFPAQETTMSLDKKQFMEATAESAKSIDTYEGNIQILSVKIASNKKSAIVETKSKEEVVVPIAQDGNIQEVPVEGDSICTQTLMLSKKGIIQMFSAQCVTDIAFVGGDDGLPY